MPIHVCFITCLHQLCIVSLQILHSKTQTIPKSLSIWSLDPLSMAKAVTFCPSHLLISLYQFYKYLKVKLYCLTMMDTENGNIKQSVQLNDQTLTRLDGQTTRPLSTRGVPDGLCFCKILLVIKKYTSSSATQINEVVDVTPHRNYGPYFKQR